MRKTAYILILAVSLFGLLSCEKDETKLVISSNPTLPAFTNQTSGANIEFDISQANDAYVYEWSQANFGFDAVVTYSIQMDKAGNNFADYLTLGSATNSGTLTILVNDLNNKLLAMEVDPDAPTALELEFRIKASLSSNEAPYYSAVITQTIKPFYIPIVYPNIFVPGSYQGWDPSNTTTVIYSVKSDNKYEGYVWFGADNAEFKYTEGPNWDVNWGDDGANGTLESNGANILAGGPAGMYKLNVDLNAKTHSFMRTDWGLIGSATPGVWDSDQNMTYDEATNTLKITLDLAAGDIKFRANDAWDLNYGDTGANGTLEAGGDNIAIAEAGNYTITLELNKAVYRYKIKKN